MRRAAAVLDRIAHSGVRAFRIHAKSHRKQRFTACFDHTVWKPLFGGQTRPAQLRGKIFAQLWSPQILDPLPPLNSKDVQESQVPGRVYD